MKSFKEYLEEGRVKDFAKRAALTAAIGAIGGGIGLAKMKQNQDIQNMGAAMGLREPPAPLSKAKALTGAGLGAAITGAASTLIPIKPSPRKSKKK